MLTLAFSPLTNTRPAGDSWGIDATFRYGDDNSLMATTGSGIIDSGVSLIYLDSGKLLIP